MNRQIVTYGTDPIQQKGLAPIYNLRHVANGSTYEVKIDDCVLMVECSGSTTTTINLDALVDFPDGKLIIIKDYKGAASSANIEVNATNAIDAFSFTYTMAFDYEALTVVHYGNKWWML